MTDARLRNLWFPETLAVHLQGAEFVVSAMTAPRERVRDHEIVALDTDHGSLLRRGGTARFIRWIETRDG